MFGNSAAMPIKDYANSLEKKEVQEVCSSENILQI
jgi:hypothetical protein